MLIRNSTNSCYCSMKVANYILPFRSQNLHRRARE